jgi:hypothetical protein
MKQRRSKTEGVLPYDRSFLQLIMSKYLIFLRHRSFTQTLSRKVFSKEKSEIAYGQVGQKWSVMVAIEKKL